MSDITAIYHPGVVQFVPQYDIGAPHLAANVLYFSTGATGLTTSQLTNAQGVFNTNWKTVWQDIAASGTKYMGAIVTDMSSNTGLQVSNVGFTPVFGSISGPPMSDGTAVLLSLKTPTRYKGGHGRLYLPGVASAAVSNDGRTVIPATATLVQSDWQTLLNAMSAISGAGGGPYTSVVWHKKLSTNPNSIETVLSMTCQSVLATQRRRLRKVPRHRRRI